MKRLIYLTLPFMVLFLCTFIMGFPSHAKAENSTASPSSSLSTTPSDSAPIEITDWEVNKFTVNRIHLLLQGNSSASLDLPQLDGTIQFYQKDAGFAEKDVCYSVNYETAAFDSAYSNQTGLFFLKCSIVLEDERYVMSSDISSEISIPIFLYNPNQPSSLPPLDSKLNKHDAMKTFQIVTDIHTDLQTVEAQLISDYPYQSFYVYFDGGYYLKLPNDWDLDAVETGIPGVYPAYCRPQLPKGVLIERVPETVCSINIQDPETFTLSSFISFGNNIVATWLYPTPDLSRFQLRYRIGDGNWVVDTDEYFMRLHTNTDGKLFLYLNPWEMEKDIHYQFQLEYDGVNSNILHLCVNKDGFYIPNEGDEDGGDRNTQTPPDVVQPPQNSSDSDTPSEDNNAADTSDQTSQSEAKSSPKTSATAETDTSKSTTLSSRRIRKYLEISPGLPLIFEKDLIRVSISADSPVLLNLSDSDFLHVEIDELSADTLRLTVALNDVPLTGIPMTVTMPWTKNAKIEELQVKEEASEWVGNVDALDAEGSISFTVTQSGIYTVQPSASEESAAEESTEKESTEKEEQDIQSELESKVSHKPAANVLSVIGIPAILILGCISVITFLYYKRKKD